MYTPGGWKWWNKHLIAAWVLELYKKSKIKEYLHLIKEISLSMPAMKRLEHKQKHMLELQIVATKF